MFSARFSPLYFSTYLIDKNFSEDIMNLMFRNSTPPAPSNPTIPVG